ncbi:outer membrane protein assembly factor BamB family protein [Streptomyces lavendulocolor]|uniref:outer membrane protein assembly factor BamB family protein n=1 Tax=Streptomyces lavendulocolor TaxID=67316 RepID=UPI003C2E79DB
MTQPPPPPNQPPSGGFGAPQDPPPQGFGAPTPPPQDPAYGYPQGQPPQPPQTPPPAQPPGYGYPQAPGPQAPGPYPPAPQSGPGYPQQPAYGYPTAPMQHPVPPQQGAGGGRKLSTQMQIIIAAVVAVVLIVGTGIWYASSKDDPAGEAKGSTGTGDTTGGKGSGGAPGGSGKEKAPGNTKAKVAFQLPLPKVTDITNVAGSWATDKAYVKTGIESVVGYDIAKGTPLWTTALPGQVCAASRHVKDNKTAIVFEAAKRVPPKNFQPCTEVGVIDLATGKLLWRKSVTSPDSGDEKAGFDEVTIGATTVAAGGLDGGAAWDLATGKELWKPQVDAEECEDRGYGGGEALVAARLCGSIDNGYLLIQNLDPKTGAPLSSFKMPAGVEDAGIVSTKPLVVAADVGDTAGDGSGISDFFSIDEKTGKLKVKIAADAERYAAECDSTGVEVCHRVVVGNNRLYLPTEDHEGGGEYGDTNEIVSFDLTTGKPTTDKADAGDRYSMFPLRMDGGNIIAYKKPPYDKGGQVVSIDGATFKQTVLLENPSDKSVRDAESSFVLDSAEIVYTNGRLFIADDLFDAPSGSSTDRKEYLAISFSTS